MAYVTAEPCIGTKARRGPAVAALALVLALALAACGSTKIITRTRTVVTTATPATTTQSTTAATSTTSTPATTGTTGTAGSSVPALNGSYALQGKEALDPYLPYNSHDGVTPNHTDLNWITLGGTCAKGACQVRLRRVLSDNTIETLTLHSGSPAGVYTGVIPGGDGDASCSNGGSAAVRLSMIVRVGGLQDIAGQQTATRLAGHIFADYTCPGQQPTHDVASYTGSRG